MGRKKKKIVDDSFPITKQELTHMYHNKKMTIRDIAGERGFTRGQVEHWMDAYGIQARSYREAIKLRSKQYKEAKMDEARMLLEESLKNIPYSAREIVPVESAQLLVPLFLDGNKDCVVTFVISDLHIGDSNHLEDTYWSTIANTCLILRYLKQNMNIKKFNLVLNGDIVAGRNVFRLQVLKNILQKGHWQVFMAEYVLAQTIEQLEKSSGTKLGNIYMTRGNHENFATNFVLFLKRLLGSKARYLSHGGLVDVGAPLGEYNVFFTHGRSYSEYSPVAPRILRDCMNAVNEYRARNINVRRVCTGHTHWLSTNQIYGNIYWDVTGGFQNWEYTVTQRPSGGILYIYHNNDVSAVQVRPDPKIEQEDLNNSGIEYKNLVYYGRFLQKHLKEFESR